MSITRDIRGYADTAIDHGKQIIDQAQAQFNGVAGTVLAPANEFLGKLAGTARSNVSDARDRTAGTVGGLRKQAEKAVNIDAVRSSVEPYLAQANAYRAAVTDRAEALFSAVTSDSRVNRAIDSFESMSDLVVETVQQRVVTPVLTLAGRPPAAPGDTTPVAKAPVATAPARKPAAKTTARKPAATSTARKPAATSTARKPAATSTARKPAAKTTARKPAAKTTARKPAATSTARKPAATSTTRQAGPSA